MSCAVGAGEVEREDALTAEYDVVVVGAGPAGSAAATRLARAGHRVLLLDRAGFPREKPCGECISPAAVQALERLGALERVLAEEHRELRGWRVRSGSGGEFEGRFPPQAVGVALRRSRLDAALLEHARDAGVEVRTGARVTDLLRSGGRVAGVRIGRREDGEDVRAGLVIGADGLRSVVVRRLKLLRRGPRLRKIALTSHVRGADPGAVGELHVEDWGCVGVAAVGGGIANVTVVVGEPEGRRVRRDRERYFDRAMATVPGLAGAVREGPVIATGPFDWPIRSAVAHGAIVVGDAAGYYDPFTGQGIYRALRGAELASEAATAALRAGDVSPAALHRYERARRREFGPGERLQRLIEGFVARPRLLGWVARRLGRRPAIADALVAVTGDLAPVRTLATPSVIVGLLT